MSQPVASTAQSEDRKRRHPIGGALARINRAYSAYSWGHRLVSWLFSSATLAVIGTSTAMIAYDLVLPRARVVTIADIEPEEAVTHRLGDRSRLFLITGYDDRSRRATFGIIVLDKAYTWVRRSTHQLAEDGRPLPSAALLETALGGPVKEHLAAGRGAIAVGVASEEGEAATETQRARERAEQTARWLRMLLGPAKPLWTLNLGQYRSTGLDFDAGTTSWQRPFIVISITSADRGINMEEALADAMRARSNLPSPASYTRFDLDIVEP